MKNFKMKARNPSSIEIPEKKLGYKKKKFGRNLVIVLMTVLFTYIVINVFPVRLICVTGNSMLPAYKDTEIIWAKKLYHTKGKSAYKGVTYGDVVITYKSGVYIIKRVVGCPGDTVTIKNGELYVNGVISEYNNGYDLMEDDGEYNNVTLNDKQYFLLGDNRNHSDDSRVFGPVDSLLYKVFN